MTLEITQLAGTNTRVTFTPDRTAVKLSRFSAPVAEELVRAALIARTRLGDITFGWRGKVGHNLEGTAFRFDLWNNRKTIRKRIVVKQAAIIEHAAMDGSSE